MCILPVLFLQFPLYELAVYVAWQLVVKIHCGWNFVAAQTLLLAVLEYFLRGGDLSRSQLHTRQRRLAEVGGGGARITLP